MAQAELCVIWLETMGLHLYPQWEEHLYPQEEQSLLVALEKMIVMSGAGVSEEFDDADQVLQTCLH